MNLTKTIAARSRAFQLSTGLALASVFLVGCLDAQGHSGPEETEKTTGAVFYGDGVPNPTGVEKALVYFEDPGSGWCTGTMLTRDWMLTATHCFAMANGVPADSITIYHTPTKGMSGATPDHIYLSPDHAIDVALVKVVPPIDVDPAGPLTVPLFIGSDFEAGRPVAVYGYSYMRNYINMNACAEDAACGKDFRCDTGHGRCYKSIRIVAPPSGDCVDKSQCPNAYDCDAARHVCYVQSGLVKADENSHACVSNGNCSGTDLCDPVIRGCGPMIACAAKTDCPAGFGCGQDFECIEPSVLVDADHCDMATTCTKNQSCPGANLCVDKHCCEPTSGLRTAVLDSVVSRNYFQLTGEAAWNGRMSMLDTPNVRGQHIEHGDSGGPHFAGNALIGVTSNPMITTYSMSFRDWVNSMISPQTATPSITATKRHDSFGAGTDQMLTGDFNGDHRTDLLWMQPSGSGFKAAISLAGSDGSYGAAVVSTNTFEAGRKFLVGDVTGDGWDDIVALKSDSDAAAQVWSFVGSTFVSQGNWATRGLFAATDDLRLADLNGDSYVDLVAFRTGSVVAFFGCGAVTGKEQVPGCGTQHNRFGTAQNWFGQLAGTANFVGDFNGDGYMDILAANSTMIEVGTAKIRACQTSADCSDGCGVWRNECRADFGQPPTTTRIWSTGMGIPSFVADVNGDSFDDLVFVNTSTGRVDVAMANPSAPSAPMFKAKVKLSDNFCKGVLCLPGDNNRDGRVDVIKFLRDSVTGTSARDVIAGVVP